MRPTLAKARSELTLDEGHKPNLELFQTFADPFIIADCHGVPRR
jgi:hypothetical protein